MWGGDGVAGSACWGCDSDSLATLKVELQISGSPHQKRTNGASGLALLSLKPSRLDEDDVPSASRSQKALGALTNGLGIERLA